MKAKTAIITHYGTGGSLLYLQQLAGALENRCYQVVFYLPKNTDIGIKNNSSCRYILKEPSTSPAFLKVKFLKYLYHLSKYLYNTLIIRPERHVRVVHLLFPFYLTDFITVFRLKRKGLKIVLTVHEIFPHKPFLGGKIDRKIIKRLYEKADLLLVHTDSLKDELINLYSISPQKVQVVPHGYFKLPQSPVDTATLKKKYHLPSDKKTLLFFGNIRENKGLGILLDVMQGLKDNYFLLIAGQIAGASETPTEYYKEKIKNNDISDSIYWIESYIPDEEASEVFKIADAVILPYKKSFHAQSGVLNLAIGYEKPCVVSDVGGIGEIVRDHDLGIVVEPESPAELKAGIISLFNNKDKQTYGFKKYKEEKSWDKVVDRLIEEYRLLQSGAL